jgi:hypothetical protein
MPEITREQTLDALQNGWATYVSRFNKRPPDLQAEFLKKQGYVRLADLLGHVVAWWEEGEKIITGILMDPAYRWEEYDIDAFNARAIKRFSKLDEADVVNSFNLARISFVALVTNLPDEAFANKKILSWLHADVIEHLQDHDIL